MKKVAFIFPGQGSQMVGMGQDFTEIYASADMRYKEAEDVLNFSLMEYSFRGPEDKLRQTYITQPALFVHSAIITDLLENHGIKPVATAGHSLGEYSALYAAGAGDFAEILEVVKVRGALMQEAGENAPGSMAAIIGADEDAVTKLCKEASSSGEVSPANFNAPGQIVISGSVDGVKNAVKMAKDFGARKALELNVSGAFHSPLMAYASEGLNEKIDAADWSETEVPVFANVTANAVTKVDEIKDNLKKQLLNPVKWSDSIINMSKEDIDAFVEVGSGKVLQGLSKRINREIPCYTVGTVDELEEIDDLLA